MKKLLIKIRKVKNTDAKTIINKKIKEFKTIQNNKNKIFSELCFCLMTANWQAKKAITLQKELEKYFLKSNKKILAKKLKEGGHRFWPQRAEAIIRARKNKEELCALILKEKDEIKIREWIVKNIWGLGMKESSHFLRNIGYNNVAIIDFHIIDLLVKEKLVKKPKTISPKNYVKIEKILKKISTEANLNLAELDLYLWYIETGQILK